MTAVRICPGLSTPPFLSPSFQSGKENVDENTRTKSGVLKTPSVFMRKWLRQTKRKMLKDYLHEFTAFGGVVFCLFCIALSFFVGAGEIGTLLALTLFLCYLIGFPLKILLYKDRPIPKPYKNIIEKFDASSFPSVHSMRSVSFATVSAWYFESALFAVFVTLLTFGVMYTRIKLQKHFVIDVVVGTLIGFGIGCVVLLAKSFGVLAEFGLL